MKDKPVIAFHGSASVKSKYVRRVEAHRKADELVSGVGYENVNGKVRACGVGCTFNTYDHKRGPIEIGFPTQLMTLEDALFEGLASYGDGKEHLAFPTAFLKAVKPGADLSLIVPKFALWLLSEGSPVKFDRDKFPMVQTAIDGVAALYREWIGAGAKPSSDRWSAARSAAWSAARSAAWSAAESAARSAAWSATESAAWSAAESAARYAARSATESAAWSAAWSAAESAAWRSMRDKLLSLLSEAA